MKRIPKADWDKVHELACEIANAASADNDVVLESKTEALLSVLDELEANHGVLSRITATRADYASNPIDSRKLYLKALRQAEAEGDVQNLELIRESLAELSDEAVIEVIEVAAGLVFRDGKLLITQRYADAHLGGLWEFPGGKRECDESFAQCLVRELREELGIEVEVGERIDVIAHEYPEKKVLLEFFRCLWLSNEPQPLGCPAFAWITRGELDRYEFPAADARLIEKLRASDVLWQ